MKRFKILIKQKLFETLRTETDDFQIMFFLFEIAKC